MYAEKREKEKMSSENEFVREAKRRMTEYYRRKEAAKK